MSSREIDVIKSKIDITELISGYVKLTPAGANHRACCPFHNEKTPSFMVNSDKQIWKCFGCGEGGDIFEFLMKMEGLEFPEALKVLAQKAGVKLSGRQHQSDNKKGRLFEACELATKYWRKVLLESSQSNEAREYVKKRDLKPETVEDFKIGYAVDSWDDLIKFLISRGFNDQEIFLAGLSVKKDKSVGFYNRFRNRLMFPIMDLSGRVIGFGGRTLSSDDMAKYINSPQTSVYNKSMILYGLYQAKDAIKENDQCVLVEGYMDVVPSHQMGVKNVVAISGTALTVEQIKILKRYSNNIALALDMDLAGQKAAERSIDLALANEMNVKVITTPNGKDPGECIANNPDQWIKAISDAKPVMEYFFDYFSDGKDVSDPAVKNTLIDLLLEKMSKIGNAIEQDHWLKEFSQRLLISDGVLRERAIKVFNQNNVQAPTYDAESEEARPAEITQDVKLFKRILAAILTEPQHLSHVINDLSLDFINDGLARQVYNSLVLFYNENKEIFRKIAKNEDDGPDFFDLLNDWFKKDNINNKKEATEFLSEAFLLSQNDFLELEDIDLKLDVDIAIRTMKRSYLDLRINKLKQELAKAEKEPSSPEINKIYAELGDLTREKNLQ